MSNMGVGASVLGYSNNFVNKEVKKAIDKGIKHVKLQNMTLQKNSKR